MIDEGAKGFRVDSAIILAAGTASRFAPLSFERPKALTSVRGEVLIERQIRQLREAGVDNIVVVVGYMKESFDYLKTQYFVTLIENPHYDTRNNHSSIYVAKEYIKNSYICSGDNYFPENPFSGHESGSYYSTLYAPENTDEWCVQTDKTGDICSITIGGRSAWYMCGHVFWDEIFSGKFLHILDREYNLPQTRDKYWEDIYREHLRELNMKARHYGDDQIFEFDTLEELRAFDPQYRADSGSEILKVISCKLGIKEGDLHDFRPIMGEGNRSAGFYFSALEKEYSYRYSEKEVKEIV